MTRSFPENSENQSVAMSLLLRAYVKQVEGDGRNYGMGDLGFEIQLPTLDEYCINFTQTDYPASLKPGFSNQQWELEEINRWVDEGGEDTLVDGKTDPIPVDRRELEQKLAKLGLSLDQIAGEYYALALKYPRGVRVRDTTDYE